MPEHKHKLFLSEQFVDRNPEMKLVKEALVKKRSGVFIFEGDRGVGKTSLLFALFLMLGKIPDVKPFVVSMLPYEAPELQQAENAWINQERSFGKDDLDDLLQKVTSYWNIKDILNAGGDARKEYFARSVAGAQENTIPVLLVDSIYECDDKARQVLEEYLITPLVSSGRGFIILSGRGKSPVWSRHELRQEPILLHEFNKDQTAELLEKINSKHQKDLNLIQTLSAGYPLLSKLLGSADEDPKDFLGKAIDILLRETLASKVSAENYPEIRQQLEKLAVIPTVFRSMEVENYLFAGEDDSQVRKARTSELVNNVLLGSHIMKYKGGGYTINNSISEPLREFLKLERNSKTLERYRALLVKNYDDLSDKYPDAREYYEELKRGLQSA